ncbi:hypothetical protein Q7P35_012167 [Cladosporium inversicolor]
MATNATDHELEHLPISDTIETIAGDVASNKWPGIIPGPDLMVGFAHGAAPSLPVGLTTSSAWPTEPLGEQAATFSSSILQSVDFSIGLDDFNVFHQLPNFSLSQGPASMAIPQRVLALPQDTHEEYANSPVDQISKVHMVCSTSSPDAMRSTSNKRTTEDTDTPASKRHRIVAESANHFDTGSDYIERHIDSPGRFASFEKTIGIDHYANVSESCTPQESITDIAESAISGSRLCDRRLVHATDYGDSPAASMISVAVCALRYNRNLQHCSMNVSREYTELLANVKVTIRLMKRLEDQSAQIVVSPLTLKAIRSLREALMYFIGLSDGLKTRPEKWKSSRFRFTRRFDIENRLESSSFWRLERSMTVAWVHYEAALLELTSEEASKRTV